MAPAEGTIVPGRAFLYGNTGAGDDDENQDEDNLDVGEDQPMAHLVASPSPIERVTQLAMGGEHGILLTDAGSVYTFGDNRYGQLGRATLAKVEGRTPHAVPNMLKYEVTQVAAGIHHCVALASPGVVWAWGRNKRGQLGCGDYRDKVLPVRVERLEPRADPTADPELIHLGNPSETTKEEEEREACRIVTIGAGIFSSLAAAYDSDVWQWGRISDDFKERKKAPAYGRGPKFVETGVRVTVTRPFRIFERPSFKQQERARDKNLITDTGCRVLSMLPQGQTKKGRDEKLARLKELVISAQQLQAVINTERAKLEKREGDSAGQGAKRADEPEEGSGQDLLLELTDTAAKMERDLIGVQYRIETLDNMLGSCDLQQEHTRKQLNTLMQQAAQLSEEQDKVNVQILNSDRKGADRKHLEQQAEQVKGFMESNKTTKMALLDQRAETDKEKQHITQELKEQQAHEQMIRQRLGILRKMMGSVSTASGISDTLIQFLKQRIDDFSHHFQERDPATCATDALQEHEIDSKFLESVEAKLQEQVRSVPDSDKSKKERAEKIRDLLLDVITLRRSWNEMLRDKWLKQESDVSYLMGGRPQPRK